MYISTFLLVFLLSFITIILYIGIKSIKNPPRSSYSYPSLINSDEMLGYSYKSNLNINYPITNNTYYKIYTDKYGFRVLSQNSETSAYSTIIAIGDSQTFGHGISYEQTYIALLSKYFQTNVANLATSGYGTVNSLLKLEKALELIKPKIIIVGHYYDHPIRNMSRCYPGFSFSCISVPFVRANQDEVKIILPNNNISAINALRNYNDYISGESKNYSFFNDFYWTGYRLFADFTQSNSFFFGRYKPDIPEETVTTKYLFTLLFKLSIEHEFQVIVLYIPNYFNRPIIRAPGYLHTLVNEYNFSLIDISDDLEKLINDNISISIPNDGHLNSQGHAIIAKSINDHIQSRETLKKLIQ